MKTRTSDRDVHVHRQKLVQHFFFCRAHVLLKIALLCDEKDEDNLATRASRSCSDIGTVPASPGPWTLTECGPAAGMSAMKV